MNALSLPNEIWEQSIISASGFTVRQDDPCHTFVTIDRDEADVSAILFMQDLAM